MKYVIRSNGHYFYHWSSKSFLKSGEEWLNQIDEADRFDQLSIAIGLMGNLYPNPVYLNNIDFIAVEK